MIRKYFAYLHRNNHWVIKCEPTKKRIMEIIEDGLSKNSMVIGMIFPFEIDEDQSDWMRKQLQLAKMSQSKAQEVASLEKEVIAFMQELKSNPRKALANPEHPSLAGTGFPGRGRTPATSLYLARCQSALFVHRTDRGANTDRFAGQRRGGVFAENR
jgi:hypothetical protein